MPTTEELEKQKLAAEIAQLEQKVLFESKNAKWSRLTNFTKFTLTFISIAAALITLIINTTTFIDQRQKEQNVELSQNMISLVDQLNKGDTYKKENAAILLSYYNREAVPILLKNLERAENPEATIYSLELIEEKPQVRSKDIVDPLLQSANKIFATHSIQDDRTVRAFRNYIRALAQLGTAKRETVLRLLENTKKRIRNANQKQNIEISSSAQHIIRTELNDAIAKIKKSTLSPNF